jgi:hypothetical protein
VYLVQREYPLPIHAYARQAACYACAAERIGRYQEVCDQLFMIPELCTSLTSDQPRLA